MSFLNALLEGVPILDTLQNHPYIQDVQVHLPRADPEASSLAIQQWQTKYKKVQLPKDYIAFLHEIESLRITWQVEWKKEMKTIGHYYIPRLNHLKPRQIVGYFHHHDTEESYIVIPIEVNEFGTTAFVFDHLHAPSIWVQDCTSSWSKVATNFTSYLRLMVYHYGIVGWQVNCFTIIKYTILLDAIYKKWNVPQHKGN